jgi:recombination protein RecA
MAKDKTFDETWGEDGYNVAIPAYKYKRILETLDSGSLTINLISGLGGFPQHCVNRILGQEAVGKSSLMYRVAKDALRKGKSVLYIDTESAFDTERAVDAGIDLSAAGNNFEVAEYRTSLIKNSPRMTLEKIAIMTGKFLNDSSKCPTGGVVIFDSLDNAMTESRIQGDVEDRHIADTARVLSAWLPELVADLRMTHSTFFFIQQARAVIDPRARKKIHYGGGHSLMHNSQFTLELINIGQLEAGDEIVGKKIKAVISKNKWGLNWVSGEYGLRSDVGPDRVGEIIDWALEAKVITRKGAWYYYVNRQWNGREALRNYLLDNLLEASLIEVAILEAFKAKEIDIKVQSEEEINKEIEGDVLPDENLA